MFLCFVYFICMHINSNIPVKFYNYFLKVFYACVYNNTFSTTLLISLFQQDMHFHVPSLETKFVLLICKVELYICIGNSKKKHSNVPRFQLVNVKKYRS